MSIDRELGQSSELPADETQTGKSTAVDAMFEEHASGIESVSRAPGAAPEGGQPGPRPPALPPMDRRVSPHIPPAIDPIMASPGLTRVLAVDPKFFPGRIIELPLDGHTLVTGSNAGGKTSLIQLIPLFTGSSPNAISAKRQGKSFFAHYLPHQTSYVAFEYRHRDGGTRSVIIYQAPSDEALRFRFVRSPLFENMFVDDFGEFVPSSELAGHLRSRGYDIASKLVDTLIDYQAIIQGTGQEGRSNRKDAIAELSAQYSLAWRGQPLSSIDRVVFAMLKKNASLTELETMVADKLVGGDEDKQVLHVSAEQKRIEDLPERYRAYTKVMGQERAARSLAESGARLVLVEKARLEDLGEMKLIAERDDAEKQDQERKAALCEERKRAETEAYDEEKLDYAAKVDEARSAMNRLRDEIDGIEQKDSDYRQLLIEQKAALVDRKSDIEAEIDRLNREQEALTGQHQGIVRQFEWLKEKEKDRAAGHKDRLEAEFETLQAGFDRDMDGLRTRHAQRLSELQGGHATEERSLNKDVTDAVAARSVATQALSNPTIPQELVEHLEAAREAVDAANESYQELLGQSAPLEATLRSRQQELETCTRQIDQTAQAIAAQVAEREAVERQKRPPTGSLLAYLRGNAPDWGEDIARAIDPDLLAREDLNPFMGQSSDSLYGLKIDLANIEPAEASDLSAFDLRIAEIEERIEALREELRDLERQRGKVTKARTDAQRDVTTHAARVDVARNKLEQAKQLRENRRRLVEEARRDAKKLAKARLETFQELEAEKQKALAALIERHRTVVSERQQADRAELEARRAIFMKAKGTIDARKQQVEQELHRALGGLDEKMAAALSEKGISPEVLNHISGSLASAREKIRQILGNAPLVEEWRRFKAQDLVRLPALRSALVEADRVHADARRRDSEFREAWNARRKELAAEIARLMERAKHLEKEIQRAERRLSRHEGGSLARPDAISRGLDDVMVSLNRHEEDAGNLRRKIESRTSAIVGVFRERAGSPACQYVDEAIVALPAKQNEEWIPMILKWFDEDHHSHRRTLEQETDLIMDAIKTGYNRLVDLDRKILAENRRLQKSLEDNNRLKVVSDIGVEISSRIRELDFYPAIQRTSRLHEERIRSGQRGLSDELMKAIEAILPHWKGTDGIKTNLRNQIQIRGYVVENGNRREFHAGTDLNDVSSNGVSYLILTNILVGFVNMVRGSDKGRPLHIVWALDELGSIDGDNTRELLRMLRENGITLVAATPDASSSVRGVFDYRVKVMPSKTVAEVKGARRSAKRLTWSPAVAIAPDVLAQASTEDLGGGHGEMA